MSDEEHLELLSVLNRTRDAVVALSVVVLIEWAVIVALICGAFNP